MQVRNTRACVKYVYRLDFCLTLHHQLGKVIQINQLDATMIYWSIRSAQHDTYVHVSSLNTVVTFNPVLCLNLVPQILSSVVTFQKLINTRWFKYGRDWFVCKQAALRSSCATCLHTNQSRSYLNHLVYTHTYIYI